MSHRLSANRPPLIPLPTNAPPSPSLPRSSPAAAQPPAMNAGKPPLPKPLKPSLRRSSLSYIATDPAAASANNHNSAAPLPPPPPPHAVHSRKRVSFGRNDVRVLPPHEVSSPEVEPPRKVSKYTEHLSPNPSPASSPSPLQNFKRKWSSPKPKVRSLSVSAEDFPDEDEDDDEDDDDDDDDDDEDDFSNQLRAIGRRSSTGFSIFRDEAVPRDTERRSDDLTDDHTISIGPDSDARRRRSSMANEDITLTMGQMQSLLAADESYDADNLPNPVNNNNDKQTVRPPVPDADVTLPLMPHVPTPSPQQQQQQQQQQQRRFSSDSNFADDEQDADDDERIRNLDIVKSVMTPPPGNEAPAKQHGSSGSDHHSSEQRRVFSTPNLIDNLQALAEEDEDDQHQPDQFNAALHLQQPQQPQLPPPPPPLPQQEQQQKNDGEKGNESEASDETKRKLFDSQDDDTLHCYPGAQQQEDQEQPSTKQAAKKGKPPLPPKQRNARVSLADMSSAPLKAGNANRDDTRSTTSRMSLAPMSAVGTGARNNNNNSRVSLALASSVREDNSGAPFPSPSPLRSKKVPLKANSPAAQRSRGTSSRMSLVPLDAVQKTENPNACRSPGSRMSLAPMTTLVDADENTSAYATDTGPVVDEEGDVAMEDVSMDDVAVPALNLDDEDEDEADQAEEQRNDSRNLSLQGEEEEEEEEEEDVIPASTTNINAQDEEDEGRDSHDTAARRTQQNTNKENEPVDLEESPDNAPSTPQKNTRQQGGIRNNASKYRTRLSNDSDDAPLEPQSPAVSSVASSRDRNLVTAAAPAPRDDEEYAPLQKRASNMTHTQTMTHHTDSTTSALSGASNPSFRSFAHRLKSRGIHFENPPAPPRSQSLMSRASPASEERQHAPALERYIVDGVRKEVLLTRLRRHIDNMRAAVDDTQRAVAMAGSRIEQQQPAIFRVVCDPDAPPTRSEFQSLVGGLKRLRKRCLFQEKVNWARERKAWESDLVKALNDMGDTLANDMAKIESDRQVEHFRQCVRRDAARANETLRQVASDDVKAARDDLQCMLSNLRANRMYVASQTEEVAELRESLRNAQDHRRLLAEQSSTLLPFDGAETSAKTRALAVKYRELNQIVSRIAGVTILSVDPGRLLEVRVASLVDIKCLLHGPKVINVTRSSRAVPNSDMHAIVDIAIAHTHFKTSSPLPHLSSSLFALNELLSRAHFAVEEARAYVTHNVVNHSHDGPKGYSVERTDDDAGIRVALTAPMFCMKRRAKFDVRVEHTVRIEHPESTVSGVRQVVEVATVHRHFGEEPCDEEIAQLVRQGAVKHGRMLSIDAALRRVWSVLHDGIA